VSAFEAEGPPRVARAMVKRFVAAMAAIVFLTAAGSATAVLLEVDTQINNFFRENVPLRVAPGVLDDVDAGKPQTILVLGSDRRWGDRTSGVKPRSDTIILIRLDPSQDATAVLSVPRDLKVAYRRPDGSSYEDKINAAYETGGPTATVRKVKQVMQGIDGRPFPIHHVVNIDFGAFTRGVKALGCFYIDVDRRYFNDNDPPHLSPTDYATIDLKPGYQKLCGQDSLDFVRFRHLDTDIVRGARQQHFLSQAKDQFGVERLFSDRERLLTTFGRYTDTDIADSAAVLRLLKLAYESSRNPLRRVRFRSSIGPSYVTATREGLRRSRDEFLQARASSGAKGTQKARTTPRPRRRRPSGPTPGLERAPQALRERAIRGAARLPFPVYAPRLLKRGSRVSDGFESLDVMRTYDLFDEDRDRHRAYRLTVEAPGVGEYYGIQGTDWKDAPIVRDPDEVRGRLMLFRDGSRLRVVAWKTPEAVYWVSNTLLRSLTNRQMLAIARSATRTGAE
jgi:LCP family protein required for cell wall assembly